MVSSIYPGLPMFTTQRGGIRYGAISLTKPYPRRLTAAELADEIETALHTVRAARREVDYAEAQLAELYLERHRRATGERLNPNGGPACTCATRRQGDPPCPRARYIWGGP